MILLEPQRAPIGWRFDLLANVVAAWSCRACRLARRSRDRALMRALAMRDRDEGLRRLHVWRTRHVEIDVGKEGRNLGGRCTQDLRCGMTNRGRFPFTICDGRCGCELGSSVGALPRLPTTAGVGRSGVKYIESNRWVRRSAGK